MAPLIAVALKFAPYLIPEAIKALGGERAAEAAKTVIEAAQTATGADTPDKALEALHGSPDAVLAYHRALLDSRLEFERLAVRRDEIAAQDRDSARRMAAETKAHTPAVLSWLIVGATLGLEGYVLLCGIPAGASELVVGRVLGTLDMAFGTTLAYWLGTSASSRAKDDVIRLAATRP